MHVSGIFFVFSGAQIRAHFQWNLGDFWQILEKKSQSYNFFLCSQHTHTQATW